MNTRDIKTKKPWRRIRPDGYKSSGFASADAMPNMPPGMINFDIMTQADFIKEFYPSGHIVNSPEIYPDIWREEVSPVLDENGNDTGRTTKKYYREPVPRYAFAFQRIITVKHLVHVCGNDIQFELNSNSAEENEMNTFSRLRTGWLEKDMEVAFYQMIKSVKITGDGAFVCYMKDNAFHWKVFSFFNGDVLYPHYDPTTGRMNLLARSFSDYDESGETVTEWLEVWDDNIYYRFRQGVGKGRSFKEKVLNIFGVDGYELVEKKPHGFHRIPVAYYRNEEGPCWWASQSSCDSYDMSYSQMMHNNQTYGEPIMYFAGEGDNLDVLKGADGTIKSLSMSPDDKVGYLQAQSASDSYMRQLDTLYKMIYSQSFIVDPPELKSGDLPAAALKILYSPAYELASTEAKEFQPLLNDMVEIFRYGYGMEQECTIDFMNLSLKWWIEPYVHVNSSTVMSDLAIAVQNGFISRQTASERIETLYATNAEWDRILREMKRQQEADLLYQLKTAELNDPTDPTAD